MAIQFTEVEIDRILDSVDAALSKSAALAKSAVPTNSEANGGQITAGLKKEDMPTIPEKKEGESAPAESAPESAPAEAAPEAAAPEAAAPEAAEAAPEAEESAPEAQEGQASPEGEEALEGESDAPLSDEELSEIYGSMEPQELERHFMLIRGMLQQAYAKEGGEQPAAPAPEAAPAPAPVAPTPEAEPMVAKSEDVIKLQAENETLKKQYAELQKSLENTVKVLEVAFKPERKAVTSLEFIKKGEEPAIGDAKPLVKAEIVPVLNELTRSGKLSKAERDAVNDYVLNNGSMETIVEIIKRK